MDFSVTNMEPREWILPTSLTNNEVVISNAAAAASNSTPEILPDPLKPGEIRYHSWMLHNPQASVLDLRGRIVTSTLDLADAFHQLHLDPTENSQQEESSPNGRKKS